MPENAHERRFHGEPERLRSPERIALLEVDRVVALSIEGLTSPRVLDVGTGTAIFAEAFAAKGLAVAGIDANSALLEVAGQYAPQAEFKQARAEAIPYGDALFDLVFLGHLLHEADDPLRALGEARRVSRARVVVLEWPHVLEEKGPPLEHRLRVETVLDMAAQVGLDAVEHLRLTHMDLYRMAAEPLKR